MNRECIFPTNATYVKHESREFDANLVASFYITLQLRVIGVVTFHYSYYHHHYFSTQLRSIQL